MGDSTDTGIPPMLPKADCLVEIGITLKLLALRNFKWVEYPDIYHLSVGLSIKLK